MCREKYQRDEVPRQWRKLADTFTVMPPVDEELMDYSQKRRDSIACDYVLHGFGYLNRAARNQYMESAAKEMHGIVFSGKASVVLVESVNFEREPAPSEKVQSLIYLDDGLSNSLRPQFVPKRSEKKLDSHRLLLPKLWITETIRNHPAEAITLLAVAGSFMLDSILNKADPTSEFPPEEFRAKFIASELLHQAQKETPSPTIKPSQPLRDTYQDGIFSMMPNARLDIDKLEREMRIFMK